MSRHPEGRRGYWTTSSCFFINNTATTDIYTLSLHDALPICPLERAGGARQRVRQARADQRVVLDGRPGQPFEDRKSTRLNSSHTVISYAVFCLKKKNLNKDGFSAFTSANENAPEIGDWGGLV